MKLLHKTRHQFHLDAEASEKLEQLCRKSSSTKSDLVARAIEAFLENQQESETDKRISDSRG